MLRPQKQSQFKAKFITWTVALLTTLACGVCRGGSEVQALGELKIEGKYIERLTLNCNDGHIEVLTNPKEMVKLPVGQYLLWELRLQGGYDRRGMPRNSRITITKDETAVLKAGGPLKQTINVQRQGRILKMTYDLVGVGGETYTATRNARGRPAFAVYKGDRKIAGDEFEFG